MQFPRTPIPVAQTAAVDTRIIKTKAAYPDMFAYYHAITPFQSEWFNSSTWKGKGKGITDIINTRQYKMRTALKCFLGVFILALFPSWWSDRRDSYRTVPWRLRFFPEIIPMYAFAPEITVSSFLPEKAFPMLAVSLQMVWRQCRTADRPRVGEGTGNHSRH